ncbi:exodeoxyribonuclease VII small subunit [Saccharicrinis sp. FJH2]|uniref:exodeoxyribonuclease VII small subunit n=1 Tax=unclassified Saccharicrinis TaxID=2646859 RepID=UPI0035D3EB74
MESEELNYSDALAELEQILEQIEGDELNIDDLLGKVKRAAVLVEACRSKLNGIETEVENILTKIK